MLKRYHHIVGGLFRLVDSCVIGVVWLVSYWIRFETPLVDITKGKPSFGQYAALTPLVVFLWMGVFQAMDVYRSRRMLRRTSEAWLLVRAHVMALVLFIALTYLFSEYVYSRAVMMFFSWLGAFCLVCSRLFLRNLLREFRKRGFNLRHVLIVGEGPAVRDFIYKTERFPELGLRVQGVLIHPSTQLQEVQGKAVLGVYADLSKIVATKKPDQVLLALPRAHGAELDQLLRSLQDETVDLQLIPDVHEYITLGCEVEDFDGMPVVRLNDSPLNGWAVPLKRVTDISLAIFALLILSPLYLFLGILIKITSKGPVFYAQERMGLDGKTFSMLKFRSMAVDAESKSGPVWAKAEDSRRTILGSFLRRTSLDELPQFWNVVKGEMSLVGPRPERPVFVEQFKSEIPHYMLRHKVKAGITGWAQVNGWRGDTSLKHRIEYDLYYIRNWSYALDIKILWLTLWKGFVNRNAY